MADLTEIDEQSSARRRRGDYSDLRALYINCTLKRSPEPSHTQALADRSIAIMRRNGVAVDVIRAIDHEIATGVWPDMTEHGWDARRVARDLRAGHGGRHPRAAVADLARREVVGLHEGHRAAVRQQPPAQRRRPVRLLRPRRRLHHHRQRGRRQALRDEHPLLAAAPRLHDPAAGRRGLARRGRPRPELHRPRLRRPGERLHQPQHGVHDVEPAARGAHAQGRRRHPRARQPAHGVGRRLPLRLPEPRAPR